MNSHLETADLCLQGGNFWLDEKELLPEVGIAQGHLFTPKESFVELNHFLLQNLLPPV